MEENETFTRSGDHIGDHLDNNAINWPRPRTAYPKSVQHARRMGWGTVLIFLVTMACAAAVGWETYHWSEVYHTDAREEQVRTNILLMQNSLGEWLSEVAIRERALRLEQETMDERIKTMAEQAFTMGYNQGALDQFKSMGGTPEPAPAEDYQ